MNENQEKEFLRLLSVAIAAINDGRAETAAFKLEVKADFARLDARIANVEADVAEVKATVARIEPDVNDIKVNLKSVGGRIDRLEEAQNDLRKETKDSLRVQNKLTTEAIVDYADLVKRVEALEQKAA